MREPRHDESPRGAENLVADSSRKTNPPSLTDARGVYSLVVDRELNTIDRAREEEPRRVARGLSTEELEWLSTHSRWVALVQWGAVLVVGVCATLASRAGAEQKAYLAPLVGLTLIDVAARWGRDRPSGS
jgi:hypothetical protein